jgi:DNA-3-methyladenine glycosylase
LTLPPSFYSRPTLEVTQDLIGKVLVHDVRGVRTSGIIVEAEAYIGEDDPACHAAPGPTARNQPLYGPPGVAYVYLNYGLHYMVNAVTEPEGRPAAVLIRALEPLEGEAAMRRRRMRVRRKLSRPVRRLDVGVHDLCRGPGNLTVALGIDLSRNRQDLTRGLQTPLRIEDHGCRPDGLTWSPRIGIRVGMDRPWRCYWKGKRSVSGNG